MYKDCKVGGLAQLLWEWIFFILAKQKTSFREERKINFKNCCTALLICIQTVAGFVTLFTEAGFAQLVERFNKYWVGGRRLDSQGQTNTQGIKITGKWRYSFCTASGLTFTWLGWPRKMAVPAQVVGDVKIVSPIGNFVLDTLTLK